MVYNNIDENVNNEVVDNSIIDNNIYVSVNRSDGSVVTLELEEYIIGVVGAEMPAAFNEQALMAQAIISRTYALKSLESGKKLTDNKIRIIIRNNEIKYDILKKKEFLFSTPEFKEFFLNALDTAEKELDFSVKDCKLLIELFYHSKDIYVFTVTKYFETDIELKQFITA